MAGVHLLARFSTAARKFPSTVFTILSLLLALAITGQVAYAQVEAPAVELTRAPPPPPAGTNGAQVEAQSVPATMVAGGLYDVSISVRNLGENSWTSANMYFLGSMSPLNNYTWGPNRIALAATEVINYWETKRFTFQVKAPLTLGIHTFHWGMLQENREWFGSTTPISVTVIAPPPVRDAQVIATSVPSSMVTGQSYNVAITMKNTGNTTWNPPLYRLGAFNPQDNLIWGIGRTEVAAPVAPGQQYQFVFRVVAPAPGNYAMQWKMLEEGQAWFGGVSNNQVTVSAPQLPTLTVRRSSSLVANTSFAFEWSSTGATSVTQVCTSNGTGYKVSETLALNGSRTQVAQSAWVGYPSSCLVTATGPGGSAVFSQTLTTSAPATSPAPTIDVKRSPAPMTAGQSFTLTWTTTNATSVTRICTASGTGFTSNGAMPATSSTQSGTASAAWVGYPSTCTWTATGSGGTAKYVETMTTVAAGAGGVTYIHTDGLGSPVVRTDASRKIVSTTRYEPYGYVASGVTPTIGFTGHVNDSDTGLTYMQQRYYDPVAGRFLSIDPKETDVANGDKFNRYTYAGNSPFNYVDPDGRDATWVARADGTSVLNIKVFGTGVGATPAAMAALKQRVEGITLPGRVTVAMEIRSEAGPGINTLNMSPGLDTTMCGGAGECVNQLGGNLGHIDSSQSGNNNAGAHEVFHFAGISDKYVEGPRTAAGERTSVPSPGYDRTNIMTARGGTTLNQEQMDEAKNHPNVIKQIEY